MNDIPLTLFAFGLDDMQAAIIWAIRGAAAVVAFVLGWFLSSPLWRILYRVFSGHGIPGGLLGMLRLTTACLLAAGAFFLALGYGPGSGGGGGFGMGDGSGFGKGKGTGTGNDTAKLDAQGKAIPGKDAHAVDAKPKETVDIEVLGGKLYKGEDKFYRIKRKDPAQTLEDVEKFVVDNKANIAKVNIIHIQKISQDEALRDLETMLKNHQITRNEVIEPNK